MNAIDEMLDGNLNIELLKAVPSGETLYIGPNGCGGSTGPVPARFEQVADRIRASAPKGALLRGWFVASSDGRRLKGQISVSANSKSPQVVWTIGSDDPSLEYARDVTLCYPSASDKLMAAAMPREALLNMDGSEDTVALLERLGYVPELPSTPTLRVGFGSLRLRSEKR